MAAEPNLGVLERFWTMIKSLSIKVWLFIGAIVLGVFFVIGFGVWWAKRSVTPPQPPPVAEGRNALGEAKEVTQLEGVVTVNIPGGVAVQEPSGKESFVLVDEFTTFMRSGEFESAKLFIAEDIKVGERITAMVVPDGEFVRAVSLILTVYPRE